MIMLKTIDTKRTFSGDSDSTVAMPYDDEGNYELIGIYKSASKRSYDSEIRAYTEYDNRTDYKYLFATNW